MGGSRASTCLRAADWIPGLWLFPQVSHLEADHPCRSQGWGYVVHRARSMTCLASARCTPAPEPALPAARLVPRPCRPRLRLAVSMQRQCRGYGSRPAMAGSRQSVRGRRPGSRAPRRPRRCSRGGCTPELWCLLSEPVLHRLSQVGMRRLSAATLCP